MLTMEGIAMAVTSRPTGWVVIRTNLVSCCSALWASLGITTTMKSYLFFRSRTGKVK